MTTADQLAIVSKLLQPGEEAHTLAQATLVADFRKTRVLLILLRSNVTKEEAVLITTTSSYPVTRVQDLEVKTALPIDDNFRFEIDSGHNNSVPDGVFLNITSNRQRFVFEMIPGYHTQNLVSELYRITDHGSRIIGSTSNSGFAWLSKYKSSDTPISSVTAAMSDLMSGAELPTAAAGSLVSSSVSDRESVVTCQLATQEEEFTKIQSHRVFVGTYNVNGQSPDRHLQDWLSMDKQPPDLYAVGFQELDLSKEAFMYTESSKEEEWTTIVKASLHPGAKYTKVESIRLVGMLLLVYVRTELEDHVTNVSVNTVATGILGMLGNKGGVGVTLRIHATELCFVCSHLAAHQHEFERRNQDFHDICDRMTFSQYKRQSLDYPPRFRRFKDFSHVFWLGDLNYRIDDFDILEVKELISENNYELLLKSDQLRQQQQQRKAFADFQEGEIKFKPTYKYNPGTDLWDDSPKCRCPAWCDRVLWRGEGVTITSYTSTDKLRVSDHKPVSASFHVDIRVVDREKRQRLKEDIMKKLDSLENAFLPEVKVDGAGNNHIIDFDTIKFNEPVSRSIAITNIGQVPAHFEFIPKPNETSYSKPWLVAEPSSALIMPGEKCDVNVQVNVNKNTAHLFNNGQEKNGLYDILVLHLNGGKDIFITVSGNYIRSCFGASIEALVQLTVPIAELDPGQVTSLEKGDLEKLPQSAVDGHREAYPVPKELWFLCDLMNSLGLDKEHLFSHHGLKHEIIMIRDWLDTGHPVDGYPEVSIHSAAEAIMILLQSFRDPVIPYDMLSSCITSSANYIECKQIISQLPTPHKNVFDYLTAFLREVISHSSKNGTDPVILATLFCTMFLRDPPNKRFGPGVSGHFNQQNHTKKKAAFLHHFLVNEPDD